MRHPHAMARLSTLLASRVDKPFSWGRHDCFLLGADAAEAVTGRDPAADLRGTYSSAVQAARVLARHGGWWLGLAKRFGQRVPPEVAWPGDVVLLPAGACNAGVGGLDGGAVGVVWRGAVVAQGESGLVALNLRDAVSIWRAC